MPIYVYKCPFPECGEVEELLTTRVTRDHPIPYCAKCDVYMERVPTAGAIIFKGSGWTPKGNGR